MSRFGISGGMGARPWLIVVLLVLTGSLRIVSTYTVFSATYDEPAHLACGLEWLSRGSYRYEPLHPPLARVAAAIGPYLHGTRTIGKPTMWEEGTALAASPDHERILFLSRLGVLPFFWIACGVVYLWGRRYLDEPTACMAVLIFSLLPPVLAHAGLATTDMALTAMLGAAFLAAAAWCERPGARSSLVLGLFTGLAVLSKFSVLAFLPVAVAAALAAWLLVERPAAASLLPALRARLPGLLLALLVVLCVIWAGYRFSFGTVGEGQLRVPAPEFFAGLWQLLLYEQVGTSWAYLLGEHSQLGWWWYYLVVLAVKTPLALFVLMAAAAPVLRRGVPRGLWLALAFSLGILGFCMANRINLGVRHVLPVYIGFSLLAAAGAMALLRRAWSFRFAPWLAAAALLALALSSALAHPDYLPYFNVLAGSHPEHILVDSDLDWGQDVKRLSQRLRQLQATQLAFNPCLQRDPATMGLPELARYDFIHPAPGWNAVRQTILQMMLADSKARHLDAPVWEESIPPRERIGAGILLWYFPPDAVPDPAPGSASIVVHCR